jgi:hypothetical protein
VDARRAGHRVRRRGSPGTYVVNLFAVLLCLLIAFVLNRGMKGAARFETYLVVLKVAIVLLVVVVGVFYIDAGNYEPVHPVRPDRRVHRRGDGVLRGLRLRRDVHRGRGVQGIAEAHAQGHHLLAGHLDGALRAGLPGAHRHGRLHPDRQRGGVLRGLRRRRAAVPRGDHRRRRDPGHPDRAVHLPDGRLPGRLLDEPRRAAAGLAVQDRPEAPRADPDHLDPRRRVRADRRLPADRRGGRADQHRHPAGLRGRVRRGDRAALPPARPAALVPLPGDAGGAGRRRGVSRCG